MCPEVALRFSDFRTGQVSFGSLGECQSPRLLTLIAVIRPARRTQRISARSFVSEKH